MAGRTMKLTHRAVSLMVREGHTGRVEIVKANGASLPCTAKTFEAATNEARKWLLENAGSMQGKYPKLVTEDADAPVS